MIRTKITKIVFTHAHPDHLWGVADDGGAFRFPNASDSVAEKEWNFWMAEDVVKKELPENFQRFALGAKRDLSRIKDKLKTVKPGDDIVSGVRIFDTAGHTPGHVSLELAGGEGLIIAGDVAVNAAVLFSLTRNAPCDGIDTGACDRQPPPFARSFRNRQDAPSRQSLAVSGAGRGRTQGRRLPVRRDELTGRAATGHSPLSRGGVTDPPVIAGLDPAIHLLTKMLLAKVMDPRVKPAGDATAVGRNKRSALRHLAARRALAP